MRGVVGAVKTGPLANQELSSYNTTTYYIKSELGGYGLYYRTVIAELGLLYPGGLGFQYPLDVPSPRGKEVAEAFRVAVSMTDYYKRYFDEDEEDVPIEVIREYARKACLCQLQPSNTLDRIHLLNIFLSEGYNPMSRVDTFRRFLDIAQQTDGYPIDQDTFWSYPVLVDSCRLTDHAAIA